MLVLEGEAGIGKTTLWREARRRAEERGYQVLWCRPSAAEAKFSFAGVADLLSPLDDAVLAPLPEPQRDALEIALLRSAPTTRSPFSRAVAAGFLTLIRELAADQHLLLAVDDWQWLDLPSRRMLEFTVRRLEAEPVGLLCSIRAPVSGPLLGDVVAEQRVTRALLGSLSLAALGQIVHARLGRSLRRSLLVRILKASGGNPFYALEVARLVIEREADAPGGSDLPVPDDLRKLTSDRIRRLPTDTREAVLLAAALPAPDGRTIDLEALAPAEEAGIVSVRERGRIEFVHPLFAAAAYGSVPVAQRRAIHSRAAEIVLDPEQRARHLALGLAGPDAHIASQLDEAAAGAAGRGAPEAAAELAELAAERTPAASAERRDARLVSAARFHFQAGDLARAELLVRQVIAGPSASPHRAGALQLAAQLAARRSNFTEATELCTAALAAAAKDQRLRAAIELDHVYCAVSLGELASAESHARAALTHAETTQAQGMQADALAVLTMAEFLLGRGLDEARLNRALALEDPHSASAFIMRPSVIKAMLALWVGRLDDAVRDLGAVAADLLQRGQEGNVPFLAFYVVWAYVWHGQLDEAARFSKSARDAAGLLDDPTTLGLVLSASALVHAHDGHSELARTEAKEALLLFEQRQWRSGVTWPLWALGLAELAEGNLLEVDAVLAPLAEQVSRMGGGDPVLMMFLPDEIEALTALGQLERAEAYLDSFESGARQLDRAWALAAAGRSRGMLAAAQAKPDQAFAAFEEALAAHERTRMPFEGARTLLAAGQAYRRFKQRRRAREMLEQALAVFEALGAPLWAAKCRAELARVGHRAPDDDELTGTERRVAELAAAGLSNREIAERAFVSVKTVEANLTRVYRKLGVRSRGGLANALRDTPRPKSLQP